MAHLMIGVSGVRGIYGDGLDEGVAERFAFAFGRLYGGPVVVGRDSRVSGGVLSRAVMTGLRKAGADVIDLGLATTPTTEMAVLEQSAAGGVIVTASHNPGEWNGLKFLGADSVFLNTAQGEELVEKYRALGDISGRTISGGLREWQGADAHHIKRILDLPVIDVQRIADRRFTVCLDAVNGVGGGICIEMLQRLGCTVHAIHARPTGEFPHGAEPTPANIVELCELVRRHGADTGFAVDPDTDRLSLVDGNGIAIGEEYTLALAADYIMDRTRGPAACNLSTSRMIDDAAERHGTVVYRSPVGEINVVELMRDVDAVIGGEGNGGVIYPVLHHGRDAVLGIALTLQMLADTGRTLTECAARFPSYVIIKEKVSITDRSSWREPVMAAFEGSTMDLRDGVKIVLPFSWVHVRASNTEPIVRVMAEARAEPEARELIKRVYAALDT